MHVVPKEVQLEPKRNMLLISPIWTALAAPLLHKGQCSVLPRVGDDVGNEYE